jgi:hypothetical protein
MYALIHKQTVLSGPREWNRAFFQTILKNKKIQGEEIPKKPVSDLPFTINEDTRIVQAEIEKPRINPLVEYHQGPSWNLENDVAIAIYEVIDTPIEFAKNNLKKIVADVRYSKEVAGTKATVQDLEVTVDTSRDGKNIFVQKYVLMGDAETVKWKFPEGWLTLTKSQLGDVVSAGEAHIQSAFDWENDYSDQIDAVATKQDLLAIKQLLDNENVAMNRSKLRKISK